MYEDLSHIQKKCCLIMQGPPGSGKSTIAKLIETALSSIGSVIIHSTDRYFINENGEYCWNYEDLEKNHCKNQQAAEESMVEGIDFVIIDNTNIRRVSAQPYIDMASMYGYSIRVIRVTTTPTEAIENCIHSAPPEVIRRAYLSLEHLP